MAGGDLRLHVGIELETMTEFKDHFSTKARAYAEFRPDYPAVLFDFAASLAPRRGIAWDCGTGAGQAAVALAARFGRVIATDASAQQLEHARPHERVEYRVAPAEDSGIDRASVDLVTVAQALHWFDLPRFYAEVRRVLAPGGAIAVWMYNDSTLDDPGLSEMLHRFNHETVLPFWPPERKHVVAGYRDLPFPFREIPAPELTLECDWALAEVIGYVRTWSAVTRYTARHGTDPVIPLEAELAAAWGDPATRRQIRWPLAIRAGYVSGGLHSD